MSSSFEFCFTVNNFGTKEMINLLRWQLYFANVEIQHFTVQKGNLTSIFKETFKVGVLEKNCLFCFNIKTINLFTVEIRIQFTNYHMNFMILLFY